MIYRCSNPNTSSAKYYYSKGIRVCEEWLDFKNFEKWALENAYNDTLTIDRIDNSKGYNPKNCQWITKSENSRKAGREKKGIWTVKRMDDAMCIAYRIYNDKAFAVRGTDVICGLSYSEALKEEQKLKQINPYKQYRILDIYGNPRKLCFNYKPRKKRKF